MMAMNWLWFGRFPITFIFLFIIIVYKITTAVHTLFEFPWNMRIYPSKFVRVSITTNGISWESANSLEHSRKKITFY